MRSDTPMITAALMLLKCFALSGQDNSSNYVLTQTMLADSLSSTEIAYYDGLGRLDVRVLSGYGSNGEDVVSANIYGGVDRVLKSWIDAPLGHSCSKPALETIEIAANAFYNNDNPYTENTFHVYGTIITDESKGPGKNWNTSHTGKARAGGEYCIRDITVDSSGRLYETTDDGLENAYNIENSVDENGCRTVTFSDMLGNIMLVRRYVSSTVTADTYYVYDQYGRLRYVLPPLLCSMTNDFTGKNTSDANIKKYAYCYEYDNRGRVLSKKLPGCTATVYAYDKSGVMIYSATGTQQASHKYTVYGYDAMNRHVYTAIIRDNKTMAMKRSGIANSIKRVSFMPNGAGTVYGYTKIDTKVSVTNIISLNYYDNYDFLSNFAVGDSLAFTVMEDYNSQFEPSLQHAKGRLTGTAARVLNADGTYGAMLPRAIYYDEGGNVVQSRERNHRGGFDVVARRLMLCGLPLSELLSHTSSDTTIVRQYDYQYDHAGRQTSYTITGPTGSQCYTEDNIYDEVGRLAGREIPGVTTVEYVLNVRSLPTRIKATHNAYQNFCQDISYLSGSNYSPSVKSVSSSGPDGTPTTFTYTYDGMCRLVKAQSNIATQFTTEYGYDKNSNPVSITRRGVKTRVGNSETYGKIDELTITYNGNQLKRVDDTCFPLIYAGAMEFVDGDTKAIEYSWDADGRMTQDKNRGITGIAYNEIGLPRSVKYNSGHGVLFDYASDGRKLKQTYVFCEPDGSTPGPIITPPIPMDPLGVSSVEALGETIVDDDTEQVLATRDYCGDCIYLNGSIERVNVPGGYIEGATGQTMSIVRDYLGSVAAVVGTDGYDAELNFYYPYGMLLNQHAAAVDTIQPYKFGGKELDRMFGLDCQDFGARWYQPSLGLWHTPDVYCEDTPWLSPYSYCAANPVNLIDPTGNYWIKAKYDNTSFYFYDSRIQSEDDITKYYGEGTKIAYVGETCTVNVIDGNTREVIDTFNLNDDGRIEMNGHILSQEYNRDELLHIGNDTFTKTSSIMNNLYGNYYGGNNPQLQNKRDSYAVPPIDELDYSAFIHDNDYDKYGAKGWPSVVFDPRTVAADFNFAKNAAFTFPRTLKGNLARVAAYEAFYRVTAMKASFLLSLPMGQTILLNTFWNYYK